MLVKACEANKSKYNQFKTFSSGFCKRLNDNLTVEKTVVINEVAKHRD